MNTRRKLPELPYEPDKAISKGGNKTCFAVKNHPELVMLRHDGLGPSCALLLDGLDDARFEQASLNTIRAAGLPAAVILDIGVTIFDGVLYAAHIMPRYVCNNRDTDDDVFLSILNETTLHQARDMIRQFKKLQPFRVEDFQFLFNEDGSFVVADPVYVEDLPMTKEVSELRQVARGARYAIAVRKGDILHLPSQCFWPAVNDWAKANRIRE